MLTTDTTHISLPFWGGAFIEATGKRFQLGCLSAFPLPFWRAFIEAVFGAHGVHALMHFPSFLEGLSLRRQQVMPRLLILTNFPSFWEGLSLRLTSPADRNSWTPISLPFGKGFH